MLRLLAQGLQSGINLLYLLRTQAGPGEASQLAEGQAAHQLHLGGGLETGSEFLLTNL